MNKTTTLLSVKKQAALLTILITSILLFSQCRKDTDENFRIVVNNFSDYDIKVFYDNKDIEYYEGEIVSEDIIGAVTVIPANSSKKVFSVYKYVWIETTNTNKTIGRKFKSDNDGPFRKIINVRNDDFY